MFKYHCLNPISAVGMNKLDENYVKTENADEADVILVRSAKMHEMEFGKNLKAIARAGAGVNNIPLDKCAEEGIVVFNTPGANANGVKELVIAGMLLAARDVVGEVQNYNALFHQTDCILVNHSLCTVKCRCTWCTCDQIKSK